jgi:hypothetical protein
MNKRDLIHKYKILGAKLLKQRRLLQVEYVRRCIAIVNELEDPEIQGRLKMLEMLQTLIKERKVGYKEAMNVVAACLALYQEVPNGSEKV